MPTLDYLKKIPTSILSDSEDSSIGKLWKIFSIQLQEVRENIYVLGDLDEIYKATGVNLDRLGDTLNQARIPGQDDDEYRLFLVIAIAKRLSGGTIPELINIGKLITGIDGGFFVPSELWELTGGEFLDGESALNGLEPLNPSQKRPASLELIVAGPVSTIMVPLLLAQTVDDIRAAGIYAKVRVGLFFKESDGLLYTTRQKTLNGLGELDGLTLLNEQANLNVETAKVGTGSTGDPLPADTDLYVPTFSDFVKIKNLAGGLRSYTISINSAQNNGEQFNEFGLFRSAQMIFKSTYSDKEKNGLLAYDFQFTEEPI